MFKTRTNFYQNSDYASKNKFNKIEPTHKKNTHIYQLTSDPIIDLPRSMCSTLAVHL